MTIDYYPTLLEITSTTGDREHNRNVDGQSLVALLKNPTTKLKRNLYWHYPHYHAGGDSPYSAIRQGNYRLIEFHEDKSYRLYNLANDIGEQTDLSTKMPNKTVALPPKLKNGVKR